MIQIRNVPDQSHRELKSRAALNGMTLSDYLLGELRALAARPTMQEWLAESETWEPGRDRPGVGRSTCAGACRGRRVIVVDAGAIADMLLARPRAQSIRTALSSHTELHVPEHFHAEVLSVLRRQLLTRRLSEVRAHRALGARRIACAPIRCAADAPIWRLRRTSRSTTQPSRLAQRLDMGRSRSTACLQRLPVTRLVSV